MKKKFEIVIGYACNFRCKYCFEQAVEGSYTHKKMSTEVIQNTIDYILKYDSTLPEEDFIQVSFFGGENFLYKDVIDAFIEGLKHRNIHISLTTNGSLIAKNKELILKWYRTLGHKFSVMVSYDYSLQDTNRCKGTYQTVRDSILWLDANNIKVHTNTIFMKENLSQFHEVFFDYLDLYKQLNRKFNFRIGMDNLNICHSQYDEKTTKQSLDIVKKFIDTHPFYSNCIVYKFGKNRYHSCGFGWRVVNGIDIDGSLYPCQGAIYDTHKSMFYMGNVSQDFDALMSKRSSFFSDFRWPIQEECKKCTAWCKSCPLETIKTSTKEFGALPPDKDHCNIHKTISIYLKNANSR